MTALEQLTTNSSLDHTLAKDQNFRLETYWQMVNERITEDIVREILKANKATYSSVTIEEQKSKNPRIEKLLQNASKQGSGAGKPEFIITFNDIPDLVIVIECKADVKKHESQTKDNYKDYAVDGALLYSSYLAKEFNVIAIGVSGERKSDLKVSTFLQLKSMNYIEKPDKKILSFKDYEILYRKDPEKEKLEISNLLRYSKKLHNELRDHAKLIESEKPLLVSAILMALSDPSFVVSYKKEKKPKDLTASLVSTVMKILSNAELPQKKIEAMKQTYNFIKLHPELTKEKDKDGKPVRLLYGIIKDIEDNVMPFADNYEHYDVIGQFFGEFLRYTGGDKQGLGIVLTPRHITELFSDLADVKKDDVVFDNCCGTSGFLISAMKKMIEDAGNDTSKIDDIKRKQLIGIEVLPNMFALACANMILRGDGKANIYQEDCFSSVNTIQKNHKCTVGFLNPPYSQKGEGLHELDFVANCLECLEKNSLCIAIIPMGRAIPPSQEKKGLLEKHTLEAVMSMPDQLFYPVGIVTCIMVFRAKVPHNKQKSTWFGYWKDDGFIKTKTDGRINKFQKWHDIKKRWVDNYINRKEIAGECVLHAVGSDDEWCAEAYMETDYSSITEKVFEKTINDYAMFNVSNPKKGDYT